MDNSHALQRARTRARAKYGFFVHLVVYLTVNGLLMAINLITSPNVYWFVWPLLGWGVAVLIHAGFALLAPDPQATVERMAQKELDKERRRAKP